MVFSSIGASVAIAVGWGMEVGAAVGVFCVAQAAKTIENTTKTNRNLDLILISFV
jgi:hypothetical protein